MMKWQVNIFIQSLSIKLLLIRLATKSFLTVTALLLSISCINHWLNNAFAGTVDLNSSNDNNMTKLNFSNNRQQPKGFLWYNEELVQELPSETNKPPSSEIPLPLNSKQEPSSKQEPYDQRIEALKRDFNRSQRKALDNPTVENIIIAQRLHKQILEKSHKFAAMWQLASLLDYKLINSNEPANSLHKKLHEVNQKENNSAKLKYLSKSWGLILQVSSECSYCHAFAPIVRQFASKYGFQLLFVSSSGVLFEDVQTAKDTGLLKQLNPEHIVPTLYLVDSKGQQIYPIARSIINEDKIAENILTIDQHYHKLATKVN